MHVLEDITKTLSVLKNDKVHEILGKYYLKIKKVCLLHFFFEYVF